MSSPLRYLTTVLAVATWLVPGSHAQGRDLEQTLAFLNQTLQSHSYVDVDGNRTTTSLKLLSGDTLAIEASQTKGANVVSTVYLVAARDIDVMTIQAREQEGHTAILIDSKGLALAHLRCAMPGGVSEWAIPAPKRVPIGLQADSRVVADVEAAIRELMRLIRAERRPNALR